MFRMSAWFFVLLFGITVSVESAQTISLSGKVSNKSGKAVSGAVVLLAGQNLKDTTDAAGAFSLTGGTFLTNPGPTLKGFEKISFINGVFTLRLPNPTRIKIELFDIKGTLLERVIEHPSSAGEYRFDLTNHPRAANVMLSRVTIGQHSSTFHFVPIGNGRREIAAFTTPCSSKKGTLAKALAGVDTLQVTATGYLSNKVEIASYQGEVNISLDTISLAKFSFFVTSFKGLQELSNSQNGFGGDLRFGKTGQGAGLLGADSICQCLAEKSMPGSKVKQWRAFLSVAKDAKGQQVNAIDRIGAGPWYDRIGRVFALTRTDLLNTRPANADKAIVNDFPNENGVPNHQPDPNLPVVDNHNTMTGSGTNGQLHTAGAAATCEDWTSSAKGSGGGGMSGSGPAIGFSWPQAGGGQGQWIYVLREGGCASGVTPAGAQMGPSGTVGALGGYGGFYCFALNP